MTLSPQAAWEEALAEFAGAYSWPTRYCGAFAHRLIELETGRQTLYPQLAKAAKSEADMIRRALVDHGTMEAAHKWVMRKVALPARGRVPERMAFLDHGEILLPGAPSWSPIQGPTRGILIFRPPDSIHWGAWAPDGFTERVSFTAWPAAHWGW